MKKMPVILLLIFIFGCTKENEETLFKKPNYNIIKNNDTLKTDSTNQNNTKTDFREKLIGTYKCKLLNKITALTYSYVIDTIVNLEVFKADNDSMLLLYDSYWKIYSKISLNKTFNFKYTAKYLIYTENATGYFSKDSLIIKSTYADGFISGGSKTFRGKKL